MILGREISLPRARRCPSRLYESATQPRISASGTRASAFAAALAIARTDPRPGGELSCRREAPHLHPRLRQDCLRCPPPDSRDAVCPDKRALKRGHARCDLLVERRDLSVQEVQVAQMTLEQEPLLGDP